MVIEDESSDVIPYGDQVVFEGYGAISTALAQARRIARSERLDLLNRQQAARQSATPAAPSGFAPSAYGGGGSR